MKLYDFYRATVAAAARERVVVAPMTALVGGRPIGRAIADTLLNSAMMEQRWTPRKTTRPSQKVWYTVDSPEVKAMSKRK